MSDLSDRFDAAAAAATSLPERPDNATMLRLYALYKQGSVGDVTGKRPGMTKFVDRAKYDAWAEVAGTSQDQAMQAYVDLVEDLQSG